LLERAGGQSLEGERRKRIKIGDQDVEVVQLTFTAAGENWNEYLVNDGSVIRLKVVATEILRVPDRYDADGNPQYVVRSTNVVTVSAPENLRRPNQ